MIRRGKREGWLQLPSEALLPWAMLNEVSFDRTVPGISEDRGGALLAKENLNADDDESRILLTVPRDLILSLERVQEHAKVDKDFREVFESLGDFGRVGSIFRSIRHPDYRRSSPMKHCYTLSLLSHVLCYILLSVSSLLTPSQTPRGAILSFLLVQAAIFCPDLPGRIGVPSPFSE